MWVPQAFSFLTPLMEGQPASLEGTHVGNRDWGQELCVSHAAGPDLSRLTGVWLVCLGTMQIGLSGKIENTKCNRGFRKQENDFSA